MVRVGLRADWTRIDNFEQIGLHLRGRGPHLPNGGKLLLCVPAERVGAQRQDRCIAELLATEAGR